MSTRSRRTARAEHLREWGSKREDKAAADLAKARQMAGQIPFGQPILVGHHSEGRDRNYRDRIGRTFDRAFENANKAESMRSRAANIEEQLAGSIYDDDPDAIEQLEKRIALLEAQRDERKAANTVYRSEHRAELKAMTAYERSHAVPFPSYAITNLTGNITRNRQRLEALRRTVTRQADAVDAGGVKVEAAAGGYGSVTFADKPDRATIDSLKAAGFVWHSGSWWGRTDQLPTGIATTAGEGS